MDIWKTVTSNYIVNVGVVACFSAQLLKTLFTLIFTKKLDLERMVGTGGMPSSHSALTTSIAVAMATKEGFASPEFGLALALAAIVMYDAMGVRRAAGEQAKVINRIVFEFTNLPFSFKKGHAAGTGHTDGEAPEKAESDRLLSKGELKEFLGHTPLEVLGGCLLGILVAVFMPVV